MNNWINYIKQNKSNGYPQIYQYAMYILILVWVCKPNTTEPKRDIAEVFERVFVRGKYGSAECRCSTNMW